MNHFFSVSFLAVVFTAAARMPVRTDQPAAEAASPKDRAAALVRQLGDRSFKVREKASRQLVEMGTAALSALRAGCKDADPEVGRRCQALLPRAMKLQIAHRLEALLADKEGKPDPDLPGWARYRREVGTHQAARRLYVDMMRASGDLVRAAEDKPAHVGDQVADRCLALHQKLFPLAPQPPRGPTLVEVATLLFVGGEPKVKLDTATCRLFCQFVDWRLLARLTADPEHECLRKLLVPFLRKCIDAGVAGAALGIALRQTPKDAVTLAVHALHGKQARGYDCAMAVLAIGRFGDKRHIALLEPLLTNRENCGAFATGSVGGMTEVGDVALASLVRLTGQTLKDYGFPAGRLDEELLRAHSPSILGFPSDKARAAAKLKWKAWAAKNLKRTQGSPGKAGERRGAP
jgi:hypothetical protein